MAESFQATAHLLKLHPICYSGDGSCSLADCLFGKPQTLPAGVSVGCQSDAAIQLFSQCGGEFGDKFVGDRLAQKESDAGRGRLEAGRRDIVCMGGNGGLLHIQTTLLPQGCISGSDGFADP